jgi:hypothetical protein
MNDLPCTLQLSYGAAIRFSTRRQLRLSNRSCAPPTLLMRPEKDRKDKLPNFPWIPECEPSNFR